MPTINLDKKRVLELIGKEISDKELKENISFLGTDLEEVNEKEIVVEIFPNRPDLLSEEGLARAYSSFVSIKKGLRKYSAKKSNYVINIKKEVKHVRPFTSCAVIKNLKLDDEKIKDIINIQEKLHVTYGRNRKRCAIGVYPMENIAWPITYTALPPNKIKFIPLEETNEMTGSQILQKHPTGKEYGYLLEKFSEYPIFMDNKKQILSMPPIINSESTGRIDNNTKEVFLECSGFDFNVVSKAVNMICAALGDMGGNIYEVLLNYEGSKKICSPLIEPEKMILPFYYIDKYLGLGLTEDKVIECLEKMGFSAEKKGHNINVQIPFYRCDVLHPIDLIEDIAIGYGYFNIKEDSNRIYTTGKEAFNNKLKRKMREIFSGLGLIETCSFSLLNGKHQKELYKTDKNIVKIKNSVSSEFDSLRYRLVPSLLKTLKDNKHNEYPQNIFEIGTIFSKNESAETGVEEKDAVGLLLCSETADFTKAKQHLQELFSSLGLVFDVEKEDSVLFLKGRCGKILFKGEKIGEFGELNPEILSVFEIDVPVSGFEIEIENIVKALNN